MKYFLTFLLLVSSTVLTALTDAEIEQIGQEAYIYGYPLITMEMTRRVMTNVTEPQDFKAPMGQFFHAKTFPDANTTLFTAPNADTLYSMAWLDVSYDGYLLHVPDEAGRYYLMPLLNGWREVFESPGKRTTGTKAASFLITGPDWNGSVPQHITQIKSPTNLVWIIGRTYSNGTPEDLKAANALQDLYTLTPLLYFNRPYTPPKGKVDPSIDMKTPIREQVNRLDAKTYFNLLAHLMESNPPSNADAPIVAKMARIGILPGQDVDPKFLKALEPIPQKALQNIMAQDKESGKIVNGWVYSRTTNDSTNYLQRAFEAATGTGANLPQDALYLLTKVDSANQPLNGKNNYVIHFTKAPPIKGFWSVSLYNELFLFADNSLNRYSLGSRNTLQYNPDGSLDLYIQNQTPGSDKESNWLPAPEGSFILMLRLYWPSDQILDGTWKPPAVEIKK